jgi:[ribosomal protein S5]-alanine N-acetyltransferase
VPRVPPPTERLSFRCWRTDDLALAMSLWSDARVMARVGGALDEAGVRERLDEEIRREQEHGVQYWPMFTRSDGAFAGCAGLRPYPEPGVLEAGFHLAASAWGKGFATEAGRAIVAHAHAAGLARALFAGHHPENEESRRVLTKLGFRYTHDELYPPTGLMHPGYRLALSAAP